MLCRIEISDIEKNDLVKLGNLKYENDFDRQFIFIAEHKDKLFRIDHYDAGYIYASLKDCLPGFEYFSTTRAYFKERIIEVYREMDDIIL